MSSPQGWLALSPIVLFLVLYVAVSIILDDFYKMPIAVALLIASAWAIIISRGKPLLKRIEIFSRAAGHSNILYMIWVFILAGAFAAMAKDIGAVEATVSLALHAFPPGFVVPMLFFAACFIWQSYTEGHFSETICRSYPTRQLPPRGRRSAIWPINSRQTYG